MDFHEWMHRTSSTATEAKEKKIGELVYVRAKGQSRGSVESGLRCIGRMKGWAVSLGLGRSGLSSSETISIARLGGYSKAMQALEQTISRIAPTDLPILLVGETGTGKAYLAHQIHELSSRRAEPMVRTICMRMTPEVVSAHFRSSGKRSGDTKFRGTLFLKEISELNDVSQRSLLYAIPEGDALEGSEPSGPRVISSTTVDLEQEVRAGHFRGQLYYRLRGVCLRLPSLRERKEDVPAMAEHFLAKYSLSQSRPQPKLDAEDLSRLQEWHWPGNILELENVIKQVVVLNDAKNVLAEHFRVAPTEFYGRRPAAGGQALKVATRAASRHVEEQLILDALEKWRWNRKRAARDLQISYKSLLSKLKKIGSNKVSEA
jgi:two-component system, NtrC family, response regulator AtoC